MNTHTNHYLLVIDPRGKQIRGQVVYFQPYDAQSQQAVVHIVTSDWLPSYGHKAVYSTPTQSIPGRYTPRGYSNAADQWLLMGTFDVTDDSAHNLS
jgi:proline racemase